jgi:hypothetical protein
MLPSIYSKDFPQAIQTSLSSLPVLPPQILMQQMALLWLAVQQTPPFLLQEVVEGKS